MATLLVAIHDVAPATLPECRTLLRWVWDLVPDAPVTLLGVPRWHDGETLDASVECRSWIDRCLARGGEILLHGYLHRDAGPAPATLGDWWRRRVLTASEGELAACGTEHARVRVEQGLQMFARCGWRTAGFVPPAWQISDESIAALREASLAYCTVTSGFHDLRRGRTLAVPVIATSARSGMRRIASRSWLAAAVRTYREQDCVRVALHPEDARHPDVARAWRRALATLLAARQPLTKSAWFERRSIR